MSKKVSINWDTANDYTKGVCSEAVVWWNAVFRAIGCVLPTATTASKTTYVGAIYNATDSKWDVVAVSTEA